MNKRRALLILSISLSIFAHAQEKKKGRLFDIFFGKNLRFIGNPILQNSPETGLKMGLAGNYFFKTGNDSLTRSSNLYLQIAYTTKQQFILEPIWNVFTPKEKFILRGRAGYLNFTDQYWGVGPLTEASSKANLSYQRIYLQSKVLRKVRGNWFAGAQLRYSNIYELTWTNTITPEIEGNKGSTVAGIGPNVQADFRDNPFSPQKGWYADVYYARFGPWVGGTHAFDEVQADFRYYLPLRKPYQVLAFQAFGNFSQGFVPFRELPRLGSSFLMRGYFEGRFRDHNYLAAQMEFRQPVYKWLHASAFLAVGEVAPEIRLFNTQSIKSTAGMGLRILLNKKESVFARFDFAVNNEGGTGFYIRINDAF
ncbi:MAG: BamA/TamA family outer membrane protein [Bacteroidia bacterium]